MSDLLTKEIKIRGASYVVSEMDASTAAELRKATAAGDAGLDMLVAERCCLTPKLTKDMVAKFPNFVVKQLSKAALALGEDEPGEKNA